MGWFKTGKEARALLEAHHKRIDESRARYWEHLAASAYQASDPDEFDLFADPSYEDYLDFWDLDDRCRHGGA